MVKVTIRMNEKKSFVFREREIFFDANWLDFDTFMFQFGDGQFVDSENDAYFICFEYHVYDEKWVVNIHWEYDVKELDTNDQYAYTFDNYITIEEIQQIKQMVVKLMTEKAYAASLKDTNTGEYVVYENDTTYVFGPEEARLIFYNETEAEKLLQIIQEDNKRNCVLILESDIRVKKQESKTQTNVKTPTLDKMLKIQTEASLCGEFLDWFLQRYTVFDRKAKREDVFVDCMGCGDYINKERLLAEFFGINLDEAEKERSILLATISH